MKLNVPTVGPACDRRIRLASLVGDATTLVEELKDKEVTKAPLPTAASKSAKLEDVGAVRKDGDVSILGGVVERRGYVCDGCYLLLWRHLLLPLASFFGGGGGKGGEGCSGGIGMGILRSRGE